MKIVSRNDLFTMPEGTLFQEYEPQIFGPLEVFEGMVNNRTFANGYVSEPVSDPSFEDVAGSYELSDMLFAAEKDGQPRPLVYGNNSFRDGCFEATQLYAVYEKQDVERLIAYLSQQLKRAY